MLLFFSNGYIYKISFELWETQEVELKDSYEYGILLGGMISLNSTKQKIKFGESGERMLSTLMLYNSKKIKKILISGASGSLKSDMIESDYLKLYLIRNGVHPADIICERSSQNTYQNALFTAKQLSKNTANLPSCLLITSEYHMKRALACFNNTNLTVDPYVIKLDEKYVDWFGYIIPQPSIIYRWNILLHEIIGFYCYKLNGYI